MAATYHHARRLYIGTTAEMAAAGAVLGVDSIGTEYWDTDVDMLYIWGGIAWVGLDTYYLRLNASNDPVTAGLEINTATTAEPVLILQTTDDNAANPTLEVQNAAGAMLAEVQSRGGLNFAAAVGQATPGIIGIGGVRFLHNYGTSNLFLGPLAGNFTLTGDRDVYIGSGGVGALTTAGLGNVCIGDRAGRVITIADNNVCLGRDSGYNLQSGDNNFNLGRNSGWANVIGNNNINIGFLSGERGTGYNNVNIGAVSNRRNQGGSNNTIIGTNAGEGTALHAKIGCVFIGYDAGRTDHNSNRLYIANSNTATPLIYGEFNTWRLALGNQYAVDKYGQLTHASGQFAAVGDAQDSRYVCRLAQASHAVNTWYTLYPDGGTTPERLTIAAETGWTVHVIVIGITAATAQQWGYEIIGVLERDGANNTTLAGQTVRTIFESDANYDAQLAADDANEALEIQVRRTGGVDYDVRWTASVRIAEVTYPA